MIIVRKISHSYKINKKHVVPIVNNIIGYKIHDVEGGVDAQKMMEILHL